MALGTLSLAANINLPAAPTAPRGPANLFQAGMALGMGLGSMLGSDGFNGSEALGDFDELPMGGLGCGFGNPMMGMPQMGQMNPQAMNLLGQLLGALMGSMAGQGAQGPNLGGFPALGPGNCMGAGGPQAMSGMGQPAAGQTIELQKGESFTTPGGATINWAGGKDEEVKISEPGSTGRNFGGGNGVNLAASFAGPGFQASLAMSMGGVPGPLGGPAQQAAQDGQPRDWRVWGDPHIDHPNGEKSDFQTKNSIFTLQDGTQVLMGADNPKGIVNRVQIVLPGGQPNWDGLDPKQTTVMQDNGKGKFEAAGTADQRMQGGFAGLPLPLVSV